MAPSYNKQASFRLAQFWKFLENRSSINIIEKIVEEGDINYAILPAESSFKLSKSHLIGYTALHVACHRHRKDAIQFLLNHDADFTKKNGDGDTVIHVLLNHIDDEQIPLDNLLIDKILSAHIARNNFCNPCNKDGLSHFHIACMKNHSEAVQFFLNNGVSVDESIPTNSKISPGYTPLHFTAKHSNSKVAEILLAFGADMYITDASGKTPLHILIEHRMEMFDSLGSAMSEKDKSYEKLQEQIHENEKIINMFLENMSSDNDCVDGIGLSNFHVACMFQDKSVAEDLVDRVIDLNQCVHKDSPLWPGYTAMHFAAHFSISTVEMLIKKGANIESKDAKGSTPLDICIERYKVKDIHNMMSLVKNWKNVLFSDGKTRLVPFLHAFADRDDFKLMISFDDISKLHIPLSSSIWPGYTPLHLAVLFAERPKKVFHEQRVTKQNMDLQIIRLCLNEGVDLTVQDSQGRTPLHLAFRLKKIAVVDIILHHSRHIPNVSDNENLTHLHIVCASYKQKPKNKLKKLEFDNSEVNAVYKGTSPANIVKPGFTPLHVAINYAFNKQDLKNTVATLLKHGANPCIKDACGLTPIHWLLGRCSKYTFKEMTRRLLKKSTNDCISEEYGISHLHIACEVDAREHMERFLNNGTDVNLAIKSIPSNDDNPLAFFSKYANYTPLHSFLTDFEFKKDLKFLLERGADVFAKKADGTIPLMHSDVQKLYFSRLKNNVELQESLEREFGWTKLHAACQAYELEELNKFEDLVEAAVDVNAKIFSNSPIWAGYTPLHVLVLRLRLMKNYERGSNVFQMTKKIICSMSKILLENGADVTVINDQGNSPVGELQYAFSHDEAVQDITTLLMKYQKDFNVNPVNDQGVSHFHIACCSNIIDAAEQFLLHGVDVNHPVDFFAKWCPGYTPLHLTTSLQVIDLLVKYGADANIENVEGYTALHEAVKRDRFDEHVVMKIIESGAEINRPNLNGKTPFETALAPMPFRTDEVLTMEKLTFFMKQGFLVNSCNPINGISYISIILNSHFKNESRQKSIVEKMMNEESTFVLGRTTLHHLVTRCVLSSDNFGLLEKSIKSGRDDIDQQDSEGKTPLHLAVEFTYKEGVQKLLDYGADINVLDKNGNTALTYAFTKSANPIYPEESESIKEILIKRGVQLMLLKLDLEKINKNIIGSRKLTCEDTRHCNFILQAARQLKIGVRSMHLIDFLSETGGVVIYPSLNQLERCQMDQYFEALDNDDSVNKIRGIFKLQYRKAVKRLELSVTAMNSLRLLLGFDLPDLCVEHLFRYLSNTDLKNIVLAEID